MSDPRNAAHDKKVKSAKKHHAAEADVKDADATLPAEVATLEKPANLEGSLAVLSQLKEMDFHSRATLERLAELTLTVGDGLKQKAFADAIGDLFSAQDAFQSKLVALIEPYKAECDRLEKLSEAA
ncbi:MAG: hypothetical protein ACAI34_03340 [Verrucomicrobium sp.]|nr:hypothetical protein [Verrucomicrobium sp.]